MVFGRILCSVLKIGRAKDLSEYGHWPGLDVSLNHIELDPSSGNAMYID